MSRANLRTPIHTNMYEEPDASERRASRTRFHGRGYPGGNPWNHPLTKSPTPPAGPRFLPGGPNKRQPRGLWPPKRPSPRVPDRPYDPTLPLNPKKQYPKQLIPGLARLFRKHPYLRLLELYDFWQYTKPEDGFYDMAGWNVICDTGLGPHAHWKVSSFNPGIACGTAGQVPSGPWGTDVTFGGNRFRWVAFGRHTPIGTVTRMTLDQQWSRSGTGTPDPLREPIPFVPGKPPVWITDPPLELEPNPPSWLDPLTPPLQYNPRPNPPPYPLVPDRPKKDLPLQDWPDWGYDPPEPPAPPGDPDLPDPPPDPPDPPRPRPPGPWTKEKKAFGPIKKRILRIWDAATETNDAADCLMEQFEEGSKRLQKMLRAAKRKKGQFNKWRFLWDHWDEVDQAAGLMCILQNNYTDRYVGYGHRALKKRGLGVGFGGTPYRRTLK